MLLYSCRPCRHPLVSPNYLAAGVYFTFYRGTGWDVFYAPGGYSSMAKHVIYSKTPRFPKICNSNGFTFFFFTEGLGGVFFTPLANIQVIGKHVVYRKSPRQGVASPVKTIGDAGKQYKQPTNTPSSPMTKHSLRLK